MATSSQTISEADFMSTIADPEDEFNVMPGLTGLSVGGIGLIYQMIQVLIVKLVIGEVHLRLGDNIIYHWPSTILVSIASPIHFTCTFLHFTICTSPFHNVPLISYIT